MTLEHLVPCRNSTLVREGFPPYCIRTLAHARSGRSIWHDEHLVPKGLRTLGVRWRCSRENEEKCRRESEWNPLIRLCFHVMVSIGTASQAVVKPLRSRDVNYRCTWSIQVSGLHEALRSGSAEGIVLRMGMGPTFCTMRLCADFLERQPDRVSSEEEIGWVPRRAVCPTMAPRRRPGFSKLLSTSF